MIQQSAKKYAYLMAACLFALAQCEIEQTSTMQVIPLYTEKDAEDDWVGTTATIATNYPNKKSVSMGRLSALVGQQAFYWVIILMTLIVGCTICFMMDMDKDKHKDTLLYAKFLANVKDK